MPIVRDTTPQERIIRRRPTAITPYRPSLALTLPLAELGRLRRVIETPTEPSPGEPDITEVPPGVLAPAQARDVARLFGQGLATLFSPLTGLGRGVTRPTFERLARIAPGVALSQRALRPLLGLPRPPTLEAARGRAVEAAGLLGEQIPYFMPWGRMARAVVPGISRGIPRPTTAIPAAPPPVAPTPTPAPTGPPNILDVARAYREAQTRTLESASTIRSLEQAGLPVPKFLRRTHEENLSRMARPLPEGVTLPEGPSPSPGSITPPQSTLGGGRTPGGGPPSPLDGRPVFDPNVPPDQPPVSTYWQRLRSWWERSVAEKLPREWRVAQRIPDSPVISQTEGFLTGLSDDLGRVISQDATVFSTPADDWITAEHRAVERIRGGGTYDEAMAEFPEPLRRAVSTLEEEFSADQAAKNLLGLRQIEEWPFPYLPRLTEEYGREVVKVFRMTNYGHDLATTLGVFERPRVFGTMQESLRAGVALQDPRIAYLLRRWASIRLQGTAKLVQSLEGKVLFRTPEAAKAASPTGTHAEVRNFIPGGRTWYARTREEAVFLKHQFQDRQSRLGTLIHLSNALFRNPNLFNPIPHIVKNMAFKYRQAGGSLLRLPIDGAEYMTGLNPQLTKRFERVMPFTKTGRLPHDILQQQLSRLSPTSVSRWLGQIIRAPGYLNVPSARVIFKWADPAMRYALWKQYLRKGLSDQSAANHAWVDLIRYSTRSEMVDMWKSWPGNFFVPWRWGTLVSLLKQVRNHPVRTAVFIGAVDYLREVRYRQTGRWIHMPIDYLEGPVARIVEDPKSAAPISLISAAFGPGGQFALSTLTSALEAIRDPGVGSEEAERIKRMFWAFSQMYDLGEQWKEYRRTGDTRHLTNILATIAAGEHQAVEYRPRRLGMFLPEWVPGLRKSQDVRRAEEYQEARQKAIELWRMRKEQRPKVPIRERLGIRP